MGSTVDLDRALAAWWQFTVAHHGIAPTMREFMESAGLSSTSVAAYHIARLHDAGLLATDETLRDASARAQYITGKGMTRILVLDGVVLDAVV